jgi:5-methylcytosine-specific restriction protein B
MPIQRSAVPLRHLSASDLGIGAEIAIQTHSSNRPDDPSLPDDDALYLEVVALLESYGGIIFTGPPGTSKSWYAAKIGSKLVDDDPDRIRFVQFHPSYQYEDFMQGFVPQTDGEGFRLVDKHFAELARRAGAQRQKTFVLVIDELSRADPGRVFGEALTYIEKSKRDLFFRLASGDDLSIPPNLVVLTTMNPTDRGVDEVDAAFERRFAKIAMEPNVAILRSMLDRNGVPEYLRDRIIIFFRQANALSLVNPQAAIGHTYFNDVRDVASLQSLWDHQLRFLVQKSHQLDRETQESLEAAFEQILEPEVPLKDNGVAEQSG